MLTTFLSYGAVASRRQGQIIQTLAMGNSQSLDDAEVVAQTVLQAMRSVGLLCGQT